MIATVLLLLMGVNVQVSQAGVERTVSVEVGESFRCDEATATISLDDVRTTNQDTVFSFSALFDDGQVFQVTQVEGEPVKLTNGNRPTVFLVPVRAQLEREAVSPVIVKQVAVVDSGFSAVLKKCNQFKFGIGTYRIQEGETVYTVHIRQHDMSLYKESGSTLVLLEIVGRSPTATWRITEVPNNSTGCRSVVKSAERERSHIFQNRLIVAGDEPDKALAIADDIFMDWVIRYPACNAEPEFTPEARRRWEIDGLPQKTGRGIKRLFRWLKS